MAILSLLALNALAYGAWFITSPLQGLGEFGPAIAPAAAGALYLVSLVGMAMLGAAAIAVLAIYLLVRGRAEGFWMAGVLGVAYLGTGILALHNQLMVDAAIYGSFGVLVTVLTGLRFLGQRSGHEPG